VFGYTSEPV